MSVLDRRVTFMIVHHRMLLFFLHVISFLNQLWHHFNAYISFMHYSDRDAGERTRWAWALCRVSCWARRKPRQAAKHDPLYLFKLMQFSDLTWVLLGFIYYIIYCILVPIFMHYPSLGLFYPCPCHMLVNWILNLTNAYPCLDYFMSLGREGKNG